ncbi:MAG: helix-hairpin-helix domain-containing protein [Cocleimonas sp.]|nr:helix-hairpin-helix domain-containing protein [Cocleimonas sp.]
MGTFVLGVLAGWLAEWLFYTFWVKRDSNSDSSACDGLRAELDAKNKELATLKVASSATTHKAASVGSSSTSSTTKKTTVAKKAAVATTKKVPAKKTPTKKSTTVKKPAAKKATPKKTAPKKVATKPATKKAAVKKSSSAKAATTSKKKVQGDDLTKLSGIGPSMAATMGELGITSYKELAAMDDDILRDMLEASGARLNNNKDAMDTWNEQALLADKGDFAGLKKLQDDLK